MAIGRKTSRQLRRPARATAGPSLRQRFRAAGGVQAVLLAAAFYAVVLVLDLWPGQPLPYRLGQYMPQDVHARVAFGVLSEKLRDAAIQRARASAPAVFGLDPSVVEDAVAALRKLPRQAADANGNVAALPQEVRTRFGLTRPDQLAAWRNYQEDPNAAKAFRQWLEELAPRMARTHVVDLKDPRVRVRPERAVLRGSDAAAEKEGSDLLDLRDRAVADEAARLAGPLPEAPRANATAWLTHVLRSRPVYRYDDAESRIRADAAEQAVRLQPPREVHIEYAVDQRLVRRTQAGSTGLSSEDLAVLQAERAALEEAPSRQGPGKWVGPLGRAGIDLLVVALLSLYVWDRRRQLRNGASRTIGLAVLLAAKAAAAKILLYSAALNPSVAVMPVLMASVMLAIAVERQFALALAAASVLLTVLVLRADLGMLLILSAGAVSAVLQLDEIRTRTRLIRVAGVSAAAVMGAVWVVALADGVPWRFALGDSLWAAGPAALVGFVTLGVLPLIERGFHVATSLTLLECCDASRPLMRRLALEAPGTYNHSLQLGAMCETAAETIGANGLLARAGAYYHDIGKINKPEYFVENQAGTFSPHEKLSPAMSLLILIGHVKDGLEMAREYGLPKVLHEFIVAHHGTTLVQYFYKAATERRRSDVDRAPDEVEFRYPGPKPRHKEPAILMLADASESSVRAMGDPTPGRIENQVHAMVTRRLMDGQLDECDLTLRQVHQIEESLIKTLCGMYHTRVSYPTPSGQKPSAAELHPRGENSKGARPPAGDDGGKTRLTEDRAAEVEAKTTEAQAG